MAPLFRSAAVIGAGTMGSGIARFLADSGISVRLCDESEAAANAGRALVATALGTERSAGEVDAVMARIAVAPDLASATSGADFVVECVPEVLDLKREVWKEISRSAPRGAVCTTNTSSFDVDAFASLMEDGSRTLGVHWYNPAYLVPCVEIVPASTTSGSAIDDTSAFLLSLGKQPVRVRNSAGFVGNRIQFAMIAEAFRCLEDDVASAEDIDAVVKSSFGFRLGEFGVFEVADMGGLDVYHAIFEYLEGELGERFRPPQALSALVAEHKLGMKSGGGIYEWPPDRRQAALAERDRRLRSRLPEAETRKR